jgi:triosephosphate isomerase
MNQRKKLIAGNWKMNKTSADAVALAREIVAATGQRTDVDIVICPPFTATESVGKVLDGSTVRLGAQNMHPEKGGAFTGEISPDMLRSLFVSHVILGHSERRALFGETDAFINLKVLSALKNQLRPIFCVGETLAEREAGATLKIVQTQVEAGLDGVGREAAAEVIIAYEPVWAIGTGKVATTAGGACVHPPAAGEAVHRAGGPENPHPLRRLDEARQRPRTARAGGHRRRADRRRVAGGAELCRADHRRRGEVMNHFPAGSSTRTSNSHHAPSFSSILPRNSFPGARVCQMSGGALKGMVIAGITPGISACLTVTVPAA